MPKMTKREATKRAARVAKAHATELPKLETRDPKDRRRSPGYKAPARGIARYPWASVIILCLLGLGVLLMYTNHVGPFAPPAKPKANTAATPIATKVASQSPCLSSSIISKITQTTPVLTAAQVQQINHNYTGPSQVTTHKLYCAGINTNRGLIVAELNPDWAPIAVNNFVFLAENHFYDGLTFHRVLTSGSLHIAQGGDPKGDGSGGPGYTIAEDPVKGSLNYTAGTLAMAKQSSAHTTGSQFFIDTADNSQALSKDYSLFGRVVQGLDIAQKLQGPSDTDKNIKPDVIYHLVVTPAS